MKKNQTIKTLMTIIITAVITFSVTILWVYGRTRDKDLTTVFGSTFKSDEIITKLNLIKNKINDEYLGEINEDQMIEWAIKGYVVGLGDQYSEYFTEEEMKDYFEDTVGEFVGIGVYITKNTETNEIVIYDTIPNSPANLSGLLAGDILIEVEGKACSGDSFDTISDSIKGKEGTKVKIKVKRIDEQNNERILDFEIERKNVEIINVTSQMLENNVGYIHILSFDGLKTAEQFEEEYDKLLESGAKSLIIDVRSNGGGIVDNATDIADLLTNKGETLLIERNKKGEEKIVTSKKDKKINMNVVLLVNKNSASASEIFAGILKESVNNATIVGEKTFGKGVIQGLYQLTDGSGFKLTIEEYLTPNRNQIDGKGIEPDIVVDDYSYNGQLDIENDTQLKKAMEILK